MWLTIVDFFQNSNLKKVEKNKYLLQLILNEFLKQNENSVSTHVQSELMQVDLTKKQLRPIEGKVDTSLTQHTSFESAVLLILQEILLILE